MQKVIIMCERIFWDDEEIETQGQLKAKLGDKAEIVANEFEPDCDEYCLCGVDVFTILTDTGVPFEQGYGDYFVPKDNWKE